MTWAAGMRVVLLAVLAVIAAPAIAGSPATGVAATEQCKALARQDFSRTRDAAFTVTAAEVVTDAGQRPYCKATGYVMPEISFEMRLPLSGWNNGFVQFGSGGWASHKFTSMCGEPLARGYACIAGDAGHQFNGGLWMQSDARTKIDWGYRATHVVALAGKALVQAFYGAAPETSLMLGCSTGGYQALVEAQRFPWDFDGIVAVAPDIDEGDLSMRTAWAARHLVADDGAPMFTTNDLAILHAAALKECDLSDGVRDGIVGDPIACRFDPRTVSCKGATSGCLSPRQVAAAIAIYGGPTTSSGEHISTGGPFPGSEMGWPDILEDVKFADNYFRFALAESPLDGFPAAKFDFDEDYKRLGLGGTFVDNNPDLRKFAQAGGKLIIVQGGNDVTEQSRAALDYYQMVERAMGGGEATRRFARFFLVPGMNHCTGGDGAFVIDYLTAIEQWAGNGPAPDVLVGAHVPAWKDGSAGYLMSKSTPVPGGEPSFTRPAFAYPLHAAYRGRGDVNKAASFLPSGK